MDKIISKERLNNFKNNLSNCVNINHKSFVNKELILSISPIKKQIGFIVTGKASIIKTDIEGNSVIMRELKENDIFSNLFFNNSNDDIFIISNDETEIIFIDYYSILKDCNMSCPFHNNLVLSLFDLLIRESSEQTEKIELLSKRTVRDKLLFFLTKRMNDDNIFKVTTSLKAISEYICVDRSNLMREIKKMEAEGLIEKNGQIIKIKNYRS